MIVVMITALVLSIDAKFPVVLLILSEAISGEIDLAIMPGDWTNQFGLNSTAINETVTSLGSDVYSPFRRFIILLL